MSRIQRHIKSQSNTISEVSNAILQKPTNAASITEETMETNEEKESVRQTSETVHAQSGLAEDTKAEGQPETTCFVKTMESKTVGFFT